MKMMFHIDDFKCTLCANWFCPPFNLPYLLPCTHSICTSCLQKASSSDHIICPQDLQACPIQSININLTTKKALERLMKQHKNYNENTQLQCIKSLSIGFDQVLSSKQRQLHNLQALIDQIFESEIERLKHIHQKIKTDINRPRRIVEDWKQIVTTHLTNIRRTHSNPDGRSSNMLQLNHYIEEGRKIKMELNQFFQLQFDIFADRVMRNPRVCFEKDFTISEETLENKLKVKTSKSNEERCNLTCIKKQANTHDRKSFLNQSSVQQKQKEKFSQNEQIEQGTVLVSACSENRKTLTTKDMRGPLSNIQLNALNGSQLLAKSNMNTFQQENGVLQTKRGTKDKQKYSQNQEKKPTATHHDIHNARLDKYIQKENKENDKNMKQRKQSENKNIRRQASPVRGKNVLNPHVKQKQDPFRNQNQNNVRKEVRKNSRVFQSEASIQNRNNSQFSLSQFQLQTLHDNDDSCKEKLRQGFAKQSSSPVLPRRNQMKYSSPHHETSSENEEQRMTKLTKMLDNISSQVSNSNSIRGSLKKSRKNSEKIQQKRVVGVHQTSVDNNSLLMSPNTIHQQYTEEAESQPVCEQQQLLNNDQLLLNDNQNGNGWQLGNMNFLKQWRLRNDSIVDHPLEVKQNTYYYNCEKQKLSYMRKMQMHRVQQALKLTTIKDNFIELINQSLHDVDMSLYLEQFDWRHSNIEIVKFVKTSLSDEQLNVLLNFLVKSGVKALVLSGNNLTDVCLDAFLNFAEVNKTLKNVYLPKNYINILKSKAKINLLKDKGLNIYI